jgi:glucose-1-phosphate thymidylyltransferase
VEDNWIDTGKMSDILAANRVMLERLDAAIDGEVDRGSRLTGRVVIETGARILQSVIDGPAIIGRDTVVDGSYIGPFTSVYHSCFIADAEISNSVILERTRIEGPCGRIEGSLIGRDAVIRHKETRPRAYRLVVGDHSEVELP